MRISTLLAHRNTDAFENRPARIACLGDSVTQGCFGIFMNRYGNVDAVRDPAAGYVRLLQEKLDFLYPAAVPCVANLGIGGDSAEGALRRFERDVVPVSPDLVTICFGLNDCMADDPDASLEKYRWAMRALLMRVFEINAEAVLLTPNMMCTYVDPAISGGALRDIAERAVRRQKDGVLTAFVDSAREIAREMGIPIADAYARWQALDRACVDTTRLLANYINHPVPEMHPLFTQKLMEQLV
jgi:lysophospholipase L1-like esterase